MRIQNSTVQDHLKLHVFFATMIRHQILHLGGEQCKYCYLRQGRGYAISAVCRHSVYLRAGLLQK